MMHAIRWIKQFAEEISAKFCCTYLKETGAICECGQQQTMDHVVNTCQLTNFDGGLRSFHDIDDEVLSWLESTVTAALVK